MDTKLLAVVEILISCLKADNKVLTFGVGGNAANAIHFAAELAGKYEKFEKPLACVDLCSNISTLSAIATDFGWEHVFERQIRGLAKKGDTVVAFSISTKGQYLQNALDQALKLGCKVVLICGKNEYWHQSWSLEEDFPVTVWELDSLDTPWVQEEQLKIIHQMCGEVKAQLNE